MTDRLPNLRNGMSFRVLAAGLFAAWISTSLLVWRIESPVPEANIRTAEDALWWGVVTVLTVGYGDRYPVTHAGRFIGFLLMIVGVIAIGILTAKISATFVERSLLRRSGAVNPGTLHDHLVVCGWKDDMATLLCHILDFNRELTARNIVLVAAISPSTFEEIRSNPRLRDLHWVDGEFYHEATLRRAAPERAKKVLILADRTPGPGGKIPEASETDARTVMTCMTLSHLSKNTLVTAEIIDSKMDQYLRIAGVSEIIYSREYSRLLLGNAAGGTGVANVIHELLDPKNPTQIATVPFPEEWTGIPFSEFRGRFEGLHAGASLLGILENTGNMQMVKEKALAEAQKTTDVRRMVDNLHRVKQLRFNHPVFHPAADYRIPPGSMAIVIESRPARAEYDPSSEGPTHERAY